MIGRSRLVGKPLAQLLLGRARHGHDVPHAHARSGRALPPRRHPLRGGGTAGVVTGDMVKDGAVVIDVGVNRLDTGKLAATWTSPP